MPPTPLSDEFPGVYVKGQVRRRDHGTIVTLFLVNGQEEGRPKDEYHLFQPELIVTGPDEATVFCKRMTRKTSAKADPGVWFEEDTLGMFYRRHVEFAVGYGVAVHAEASPDEPDRAVPVKTRVMPRHEISRTTPPTADDATLPPAFAKLDLKELADLWGEQVRAKLGPFVTAYREWIDQQETHFRQHQKSFAGYEEPPGEAVRKCRHNPARIEAGLKLLEEDEQAVEVFRFMNRAASGARVP